MMTMKALTCLFVALTAITHSAADSQLWEDLATSVGAHQMTSAFPTVDIFYEAIDHNRREGYDGFQIGCSTYNDGSELATEIHKNNYNILPYYVDHNSDMMCFLLPPQSLMTPPVPALHYLRDIIPFPPALKIQSVTYELIDYLMIKENSPYDFYQQNIITETEQFLSITLIPEFISNDRKNNMNNIYTEMITTLHSYPIKLLDKFYWSRLSTNKDVSSSYTHSNERKYEHERHKLWQTFSTILQRKLQENSDPCGFQSMTIENSEIELRLGLNAIWKSSSDRSVTLSCVGLMLSTLSLQPAVSLLTIATGPDFSNFRARSIPQSSQTGYSKGNSPYTDNDLLGQNIIVGVADTGFDDTSCFFKDPTKWVYKTSIDTPHFDSSLRKIVQYVYTSGGDNKDTPVGHGTHVAGIIAGNSYDINPSDSLYNGNGQSQFSGVAPKAKLAVIDVFNAAKRTANIPGAYQLYSTTYNTGGRIHTNSWGSFFRGKEGYYYGGDVDRYLYDRNEFIIFFAAGNSGRNGDRTIAREASIKNVISVGAGETTYHSASIDYIAPFSSRGPAYDGRIKPDIISAGASLNSARSNGDGGESCATVGMAGTSMASPSAAGAAALVMQYFDDERFWKSECNPRYPSCNTFLPTGVLVKAVLIHSAIGMKLQEGGPNLGTPPDSTQGYGRIALYTALPLKNKYDFDLFVAEKIPISAYSTLTYKADVDNSLTSFKVTIVWYDPPNSGSPSKALLHDLDLLVTSPSGAVYHGNGGNQNDDLNTNEKIEVFNPDEGEWKIEVKTRALPFSPVQEFAIVVSCDGTSHV